MMLGRRGIAEIAAEYERCKSRSTPFTKLVDGPRNKVESDPDNKPSTMQSSERQEPQRKRYRSTILSVWT